MLQRDSTRLVRDQAWGSLIPENEWQIYKQVLERVHQRHLHYAIGGGLVTSLYTRRWRNTKDMDLFVLSRDRQAFIEVLLELGFEDYYHRVPYDRGWIYRGYRQGIIIDIIWDMANYRAPVDNEWITRGLWVPMRDLTVRVLRPEELIWAKLYIVDRERCDWPELLNLLHAQARDLAWDYLLARVGEDRLLLAGLLTVFSWISPQGAQDVPEWVWHRLGLDHLPADPPEAGGKRRAALLHGFEDWFGPSEESPRATR